MCFANNFKFAKHNCHLALPVLANVRQGLAWFVRIRTKMEHGFESPSVWADYFMALKAKITKNLCINLLVYVFKELNDNKPKKHNKYI